MVVNSPRLLVLRRGWEEEEGEAGPSLHCPAISVKTLLCYSVFCRKLIWLKVFGIRISPHVNDKNRKGTPFYCNFFKQSPQLHRVKQIWEWSIFLLATHNQMTYTYNNPKFKATSQKKVNFSFVQRFFSLGITYLDTVHCPCICDFVFWEEKIQGYSERFSAIIHYSRNKEIF